MRALNRASRKRTPIRLIALVTSALMVALGIVVAANAGHGLASLPGSTFEIDDDANLKLDHAGLTDWGSILEDPDGPEMRATDAPTGQNDDSYKGGVKEDTECPGEVTGSIPNNKSDLLTFHAYEEAGTGTHPGFLNLAWSRVSDPSGTTLMDFEFNQSEEDCAVGPNKVRTEGDLLIEYAIDQGGARAEISGRFWTGSAWGPVQDLDDGTDCGGGPCAVGTINQTDIPAADSDGLGLKQERTFGEAQIDLRLIFDDDSCTSFGSAMLKSRSSDSFTSQLKDFITPIDIDLNNCGQVIIRKVTDPAGAAGDFGFTKTFDTDPSTGNTFTLSHGESQDYGKTVLFGNDYTVTEDVVEAGFDLIDIDCDASTGVDDATVDLATGKVTFDINADTDVLDCTYTNRIRGSVDILKTDDTGAVMAGVKFDLYADNAPLDGPPPAGAEDTATGDSCTTAADGTCTISNVVPGQYWVVEDTSTLPAGHDPAPDQNIVIDADNLTVSLTFVNPRQTGAIEIVKTRKHAADGPGDHPHAGVTFTVTGPGLGAGVQVATGANGTACVDDLLLSSFVGDYTVTETVPNGYEADGDLSKTVSVTQKGSCDNAATDDEAVVTFSNTPLTDVTVSVDSLVPGGTASTIECTDADGNVYNGSTGANGDGSLDVDNLLPTDPTVTLTCEVVIDP